MRSVILLKVPFEKPRPQVTKAPKRERMGRTVNAVVLSDEFAFGGWEFAGMIKGRLVVRVSFKPC